ncbi:hypothetical protein FQN54_000937 [Arachnomyces sp. PD_36]|nr:hypothetical protein FQN54_000937 [Arachnomyces sp. PD_36]
MSQPSVSDALQTSTAATGSGQEPNKGGDRGRGGRGGRGYGGVQKHYRHRDRCTFCFKRGHYEWECRQRIFQDEMVQGLVTLGSQSLRGSQRMAGGSGSHGLEDMTSQAEMGDWERTARGGRSRGHGGRGGGRGGQRGHAWTNHHGGPSGPSNDTQRQQNPSSVEQTSEINEPSDIGGPEQATQPGSERGA